MPDPRSEEAILYGSLAITLGIAERDTVIGALRDWARDPSRPIGGLLGHHGGLDRDALARLDEAARRRFESAGGGSAPLLATIPTADALWDDLSRVLADEAWRLRSHDPSRTVSDGLRSAMPEGTRGEEAGPAPDPFETCVDVPFGLDVPFAALGSEVNPIESGEPSRDDPPPGHSGTIAPPALAPLSSLGLPSGDPSGGPGSDRPRFQPSNADASEPHARSFATYNSGEANPLPTERDPNATAGPFDHEGDPLRTEAEGIGPAMPRHDRSGGRSGDLPPLSNASSSRFRVVRHHAKGGLGVVLVAFDGELRREVAIKEIQGRHADNPDSRARFLLEAEITGGLEHPGVVPVYSLGRNPDGRPYYAMRFIRGQSLRKAIEHFHDPEHGPQDPGERRLEFRALLRRFIDVCNALEYAHSRGVIHRDIKPENIMLGPYGETLVVDWGLAKAVGQTEVTSRSEEAPLRPSFDAGSTPTLDGSAIGTPAYMSPEQAEGNLELMGPPSDVYSLGATLYHLITGQPPFTDRNLFQILIKVRNGEFPPPRQVRSEIPPALDAICMTAMATRIEDRYPSCRALADDLEHWMADEPVSVYREPWTARLARWARRHRTLVTATAALLIAAVIGLSVGAVLLERERARTESQRQYALEGWESSKRNEEEAQAQRRRAEQNAEQARINAAEASENARIASRNEQRALANEQLARQNAERAESQRTIAERNFRNAIAAVDELLTKVGEIDLADVPQMEQIRRDLLEKARGFYERFLQENDGPETQRAVGRAHGRLGDIDELLGEYDRAKASYDLALAIQVPLVEASPEDAGLVEDLARTRHDLGILLKKVNDFGDSERMLSEAQAAREALAAEAPDDLDRRSDLAATTYQLGALLSRLVGRQGEARTRYESAIELQRSVVAGRGELEEDRRGLARYLNNLALLLQGTDPGSAATAFDEAVGLQRRLVEEHSDTPHYARELARTLNNQVRGLITRAPAEAEGPIREAVALAERLTADFPKVPEYWSELGGYLRNLGQILAERGRSTDDEPSRTESAEIFRKSESAFRRSVEIRTQLVASYPARPEFQHRLALTRRELATFVRLKGAPEEARELLQDSITDLRRLAQRYPEVPEYEKDLALALSERAYAAIDEPDGVGKGLEFATEALAFAEEAADALPGDSVYWDARMRLHQQVGWFLVELKRPLEVVDHARALAEQASGDPNWMFAASELSLRVADLSLTLADVPQEERGELHERHLGHAIRQLTEAAADGFSSWPKADAAFGGLRDRPEVREALELIKAQSERSR